MARVLFFLILFSAGLAGGDALAQRRADPAPPPASQPDPKAKPPAPPPLTLDNLYERLAKAKDAQEGRAIASQIERRWMRSGSDTTDLLMTRAVSLMNAKDHERALDMLDYIILLRPEWAEAYNKRATLFFVMDDYEGALRDIKATLAREPRHFGALTGLGMIFQRMENPKAALAAYQKAMDIHPRIERLKETVERLRMDTEDRRL